MIFSIKSEQLLSIIKKVSKNLEKNNLIYSLELKDDLLHIKNGGEFSIIECREEVKGVENGNVNINARLLFNIANVLGKEEDVFFSVQKSKVIIKTKNKKYKIPILEDGFIQEKEVKKDYNFRLESKTKAKEFFEKISVAIKFISKSPDELKFVGMKYDRKLSAIEILATDSRRAYLSYINDIEIENGLNICIPFNAVKLVLNSLEREKDILIYGDDLNFVISDNLTKITIKLLSCDIPNVKGIIPKDFNSEIIVETERLKDVIKNFHNISRSMGINFIDLKSNGNKISISQVSLEGDTANSDIEGEEIEGKFDIRINPTFLLESIEDIEENVTKISIKGNFKPILIEYNNSYRVFMPIRKDRKEEK